MHQEIQIHKPKHPPSIIMKLMSCFKCMDNHRESLLSFECKHNTLGSIQHSAMEGDSTSHAIEVSCGSGTTVKAKDHKIIKAP